MTILSPRMAAACAGLRSVTASPPSVVAAAGLVFFAVTILGTAMASGRCAAAADTGAIGQSVAAHLYVELSVAPAGWDGGEWLSGQSVLDARDQREDRQPRASCPASSVA